MKKVLFVISVQLCMSFLTFAQQIPEEKPYIEVTGTHEMEIIPDEIYIAIHIRERIVDKEKITVEIQETKLISLLKSTGINASDLTLTNTMANFIRVDWKKKDLITEKNYMLKVADAVMVGKVFQELDKLDIRDARIDHVDHSKMQEFRKEARIKAIKAAKDKADYLLIAIGEQTGKPLIVRENNDFVQFQNTNFNTRANFISNGYEGNYDKLSSGEHDIQFEKITLRMSVYVKFGIK
jgi:uncharacterized protein YggE